ncbi:MAG: right-handed parallel beta-helix repeat-containing protein [Ramlibacter sp.]
MIRLRFLLPLAAFAPTLLLGTGCKSTTESFEGTVPPGAGLTCSSTQGASDSAGAVAALASSPSGTCVVLAGGAYEGPFVVPAGVSLVAQNGSRVTITGGTAQSATIALAEGSQLYGVDVLDSVGVGVAVRAANALVGATTVTGAKSAALAILCKEAATPGCTTGVITLNEVRLEKSALGLWVSGAHVVMKNGSSDNHAGTSLTAAAGVVATDGASLDLDGTLVEKNQGAGILIDGAQTKASIKNVTVNENGERGVWVQKVAGTLDAPAVRLEGCTISKNKLVGVGSVAVRGIIIVGGKVVETVAVPVQTSLMKNEQVGDGVGFFDSGDIKMDGTTVESNARAAGVLDNALSSIIIVGGKVGVGASGLKFVVQNTTGSAVQVNSGDVSVPDSALGVSKPTIALPSVL